MSRRMRQSIRRSRCASLILETLEDRTLLSSSTVSALPPVASWAPAVTSVASTPPAVSADVYSSGSSEEYDNYAQKPASASTDLAANASPADPTTGEYAHAAADTTSSPAKSTSSGNVNYGGGGYVAVSASGSASGNVSESAFSYYGQQPFYRLPPDQVSPYRASGQDIPQPASDTAALLAVIASQDSPNNAGHPTAADAAGRRNADVAVVLVTARDSADPRLAREDIRPVQVTAAAEANGPLLLARETAQPDSPVAPLALSLLPGSGQVAAGMLPVDLAALERGVEQFFGQMATLGDHVSGGEAAQRLTPWLVAVALSTAALETARWRFWKPAPATTVLAAKTRGFSTIHPSGTDPFPDAS